MARDIVANIVNLRKNINQAMLQKRKEPIFTAILENELIVFNLSKMSCQTEEDFASIVEMLYKFIIEDSGEGKRFPADSRIDTMLLALRELRNHFLHAREHGKKSDVKKKYERVGDVYNRLIGKRVPFEQDWTSLRIELLKLIEDGLERTFELITQDSNVDPHIFEDSSVVIFGKGKSSAYKSKKRRLFSALSNIPVFIPQFTIHTPLPNLGIDSCARVTSRPLFDGSISQFYEFVREISQKWKSAPYLLSTYGSLNWGLSGEGYFAFGCGADNLKKELLKHTRVGIGGIMTGCYGEDYSRTCFLVISGYRKGDYVLNICADLYLSCIPTDWGKFEELFASFRHFRDAPVKIEHYTIAPTTFFSWETRQPPRVKLAIIGALGREGYRLYSKRGETDSYSGIIVKGQSFSKIKFECIQHPKDIKSPEYFNPIGQLKDVVVSITNSVPFCNEIELSSSVDVFSPHISMILFDAYGATIHGININCTDPKFIKKKN